PDRKARAFDPCEHQQGHSRDDNIHAEKRADAVSEEFAREKRKVQSVLEDPRNKLGVRKQQAGEAKYEVQRLRLHAWILSVQDVAVILSGALCREGSVQLAGST